jgi:ribosomal protein L13E
LSKSAKKEGKPKRASGAKIEGKPKTTKVKKSEKKVERKEEKRQAPVEEKPKKSVKKAAEKQEKPAREEPARTVTKTEPLNLGVPPLATISARHPGSPHERSARGFSFGELSSAEISLNLARREEVSIDVRRRSVVSQNVEALKSWLKGSGESTSGNLSQKKAAQVAVASSKG